MKYLFFGVGFVAGLVLADRFDKRVLRNTAASTLDNVVRLYPNPIYN